MSRSLVSCLSLAATTVALLGAAGCGYRIAPSARSAGDGRATEWQAQGGAVDVRKVTAIVRVTPPRVLKTQMERLAEHASDPEVADFLRGSAAGGFGSGFLMIHSDGATKAAFLVTNRHVIAGAEDAEVTFNDGTTYKGCEIVFVHPKADIAVLALPESAIRTFGSGLQPMDTEPKERLTVVATGYPGVAGKPSFQMTEGKISNATFSQPDIGMAERMLQHTAPIDPGSSGGPLTNEAGQLVGANVALIRGRSSMFFAVPAAAVVDSVRQAHALGARRRSPEWMTRELNAACASLAAELASSTPDIERVDSFVSDALVANEGLVSFAFAQSRPRIGPRFRTMFVNEPMNALRSSLLLRVLLRSQVGGGATGACGTVNPSDVASIADGKPVRAALKTRDGEMELRWSFEHGGFRIVSGDLLDVARILGAEEAEAAKKESDTKDPAKGAKEKPASKAPRATKAPGGTSRKPGR